MTLIDNLNGAIGIINERAKSRIRNCDSGILSKSDPFGRLVYEGIQGQGNDCQENGKKKANSESWPDRIKN